MEVQASIRIYGIFGEEVLHENLAGFSLSGKSNGIYIPRVILYTFLPDFV